MNIRLASAVAALALSLSAAASPVLAQNFNASVGNGSVAAARGLQGSAAYAGAVDAEDLITGSIVARRGNSSAKEGNAEQNSFPVWQYGRTSGGTVR